MNETGFGQKTKSRKVIAVCGPKNVWTKCIDMSFHLALVACVSASGSCLPPLFLLPGQCLNRDMLSKCSVPGATVTVAPKALTNQATFVFVKWLEHFAANVPSCVIQPLLLIYDGFASHYSKRIVEKAIEMKIILLLLPPNSTHILQPLDVSVFKPFKTSLRHSMDRFMIDEDVSSLTKKQAISLASSAWKNGVLAEPVLAFGQSQHRRCVHVENYTPMEVLKTEAYQATRSGSRYDKSSVRRYSSFSSRQRNA
uniref:PREDICTED: similar to ENSANGP00000028549 putative n=1 Tax=Albugo laibachii Nc14 TaxID=890382 RepID=F0W194_9STRA|nr:PREDICTED: similar to ENSANGP00000028549 putative [Albugo laibachii Nc14]|eukprot:CCA14821.1 PREDICTED: similar to ENSANGP00000028549 putative [Albugo laibachii Nc14]